MKCYESCILGIFIGALLLCLLMLLFPKGYSCEVDVGDVNHTHVRFGVMRNEL